MWGARGFNRSEMPGDYQPGIFHRVDTSASTRPMLDSFDVSILVIKKLLKKKLTEERKALLPSFVWGWVLIVLMLILGLLMTNKN